jgi:hypothetical protein
MTPSEFRHNAAGYIDSATVLIDQVAESFREAGQSAHVSIPARLQAPPQLFEQLSEARRILQQCAEWMISPHNSELEKTK